MAARRLAGSELDVDASVDAQPGRGQQPGERGGEGHLTTSTACMFEWYLQ